MDFSRLRDRRVMIAAGAGALSLLAALGVGVGALVGRASHAPPAPEPLAESAGPGSLHVEMGNGETGLDLQRPLRCFAGGQFVGMLTLAQCAQKNGVDPGSLDVGLDTAGQVAAASDSDALQPLPSAPAPPQSPDEGAAEEPIQPIASPPAACWRYAGDWRKLGELSLDDCVQALFAGRCARPGSADYGRWGADTLRLVPGRVEVGSDTGGFRPLVRQPPGECTIPHLTE